LDDLREREETLGFGTNKKPAGRPRKDAAEMRKKWLAGVSQAVIAQQDGVSQGTVSRIVRGQR